jgi:tetratricopeptide (TPR) repeat protein
MDALISGQAGIAVMIQGNEVSFFRTDLPSQELQCSPESIPYLLAGANDVAEVKATAKGEVLARLNLAWRRDRALQFVLISLDRFEADEDRMLAIECLEELFSDTKVYEHVGDRLYLAPLPPDSDPVGALSFARSSPQVGRFLTELQDDQAQIRRFRTAWDDLPLSLFETESAKREFREAAVASGAFRLLVRAWADAAAFGLATIQCHKSLMALPNYRKILQLWLGPLKPSHARLAVDKALRPEESLAPGYGDHDAARGAKVSAHGLFENVMKQKEAIVELLQKGNIAKARTYSAELVDSQLKTGGPEYAAMSLCYLAQDAKNLNYYSLQLELAQRAVEVAPEDGWAHGQVADAYVCLGQYDNALRSFQLAASFGQLAFALSGRARVLRAKGELVEALAAYEHVISSFPEEHVAWCGRAEVLRDMGKLDEALRAYDLAVEKFPDVRVPRCGRAAVLTDMGRLAEALNAYDQAISEFGKDHVALCGRADVLKEMGKLNEALEGYTAALIEFPHEPIPACGRAEVLKEMGRLPEALEAFSRAAASFPNEGVPFAGRARVLKEMGRYEDALANYEQSLQRFPDDLRTRNGKADVLKRMGQLNESLRTYDENIKRSPYDIVAWSGRADLLKELGRFREAIEAYDVLIQRNPNGLRTRNAKAAVLAIMRRHDEALALLPEGEPQTREEWVANHIRGMIYLRRGKPDLATELFERGLRQIPFAKERRYFENALAVARLKMKRFEQAIECLSDGQEPLTKVLRMHALAGLQLLTAARETFQLLESSCPPRLVPLRNELAARYKLSLKQPRHNSRWVFDEECQGVLLQAA